MFFKQFITNNIDVLSISGHIAKWKYSSLRRAYIKFKVDICGKLNDIIIK